MSHVIIVTTPANVSFAVVIAVWLSTLQLLILVSFKTGIFKLISTALVAHQCQYNAQRVMDVKWIVENRKQCQPSVSDSEFFFVCQQLYLSVYALRS